MSTARWEWWEWDDGLKDEVEVGRRWTSGTLARSIPHTSGQLRNPDPCKFAVA